MALSDRFDLTLHRHQVDHAGVIIGDIEATLAGVRSDGARLTIMLTQADYETIRDADDKDTAALRLLDETRSPHILAIEGPPF